MRMHMKVVVAPHKGIVTTVVVVGPRNGLGATASMNLFAIVFRYSAMLPLFCTPGRGSRGEVASKRNEIPIGSCVRTLHSS